MSGGRESSRIGSGLGIPVQGFTNDGRAIGTLVVDAIRYADEQDDPQADESRDRLAIVEFTATASGDSSWDIRSLNPRIMLDGGRLAERADDLPETETLPVFPAKFELRLPPLEPGDSRTWVTGVRVPSSGRIEALQWCAVAGTDAWTLLDDDPPVGTSGIARTICETAHVRGNSDRQAFDVAVTSVRARRLMLPTYLSSPPQSIHIVVSVNVTNTGNRATSFNFSAFRARDQFGRDHLPLRYDLAQDDVPRSDYALKRGDSVDIELVFRTNHENVPVQINFLAPWQNVACRSVHFIHDVTLRDGFLDVPESDRAVAEIAPAPDDARASATGFDTPVTVTRPDGVPIARFSVGQPERGWRREKPAHVTQSPRFEMIVFPVRSENLTDEVLEWIFPVLVDSEGRVTQMHPGTSLGDTGYTFVGNSAEAQPGQPREAWVMFPIPTDAEPAALLFGRFGRREQALIHLPGADPTAVVQGLGSTATVIADGADMTLAVDAVTSHSITITIGNQVPQQRGLPASQIVVHDRAGRQIDTTMDSVSSESGVIALDPNASHTLEVQHDGLLPVGSVSIVVGTSSQGRRGTAQGIVVIPG